MKSDATASNPKKVTKSLPFQAKPMLACVRRYFILLTLGILAPLAKPAFQSFRVPTDKQSADLL
jgi:hypothetical protein